MIQQFAGRSVKVLSGFIPCTKPPFQTAAGGTDNSKTNAARGVCSLGRVGWSPEPLTEISGRTSAFSGMEAE
jgi:hypothetical protein